MAVTSTRSPVVSSFIQHIRNVSPAAADCLEQIRSSRGDHVAYHAAFALIVLKERQVKYHDYLSVIDIYYFTAYQELRSFPEGLKLYKEAAQHYLINPAARDDDTQPSKPKG